MNTARTRLFSILLLCASFLLLVFPFQGLAADKIEVKFWDPDTRETWINARNLIIKDYKAKNPNVEFSFTTTDWNQLTPKLMASVSAGSPPDLYYLDTPAVAYGAASDGLIVPITDVMKKIGLDNWPKAMIDSVSLNGEIWGFPLYVYPQVVWYWKDLLQQAGLKPPGTLDDLLKAAQTLNAPPKVYGMALYNSPDEPYILAGICGSFGCRLTDENGKVTINSPETVQALNFLKALFATGSPDAVSKQDSDARLIFGAGGAALMMSSVSFSDVLLKPGSKLTPAQVGAVPVPNKARKTPATLALYSVLVIPKGAKNVAEAKKFLEFWATPPEMIKFGENTVIGHIPVMRSVSDPNSPYWKSARIAPVAEYIRAGIDGAAKDGYVLGMYPKPNPCGPKAVAAAIYPQMVSHLIGDGWTAERVATWAQDQVTKMCAK
jgi:ABC-type glycerol-3-phosphate transport system substrate-binding protein